MKIVMYNHEPELFEAGKARIYLEVDVPLEEATAIIDALRDLFGTDEQQPTSSEGREDGHGNPASAEPRVWGSLRDVPAGTVVTDPDGYFTHVSANGIAWYVDSPGEAVPEESGWKITPQDDEHGPFTEVIK